MRRARKREKGEVRKVKSMAMEKGEKECK